MPDKSLDFPSVTGIPIVEAWGADAVYQLAERPDLALFRARQLTELFIRAVMMRAGLQRTKDLSEDLRSCRSRLTPFLFRDLNWVRKRGNAAVHVETLSPPGPGAWRKDARRAVLVTAQAWAWYAGTPAPTRLRGVPTTRSGASVSDTLAQFLDEAEAAIEIHRDAKSADRLIERVMAKVNDRALSSHDRDLILLRTTSIRLAYSNHSGKPLPRHDVELSKRLLSSGDAEAIDEVVHLHNRRAAGLLNAQDVDGALQLLDPLLDWRRAREELAPSFLGDLAVRDWQRGAVLGTIGQAYAMRAHGNDDAQGARAAMLCFDEARAMFHDPDDIERQATYRLQAMCDVMRLGGTLNDSELSELDHAIDTELEPAFLAYEWHTSAFRVAVSLQAGRLRNRRPRWANKAIGHLCNSAPDAALVHPYERIAAAAARLPGGNLPKRLRARLEATCNQTGLIGWLASVHLAAIDQTAVPAPPNELRAWWQEHTLSQRAESEGAGAVLPFNWAS